MQILNISVMNRPHLTRTSWVYPIYNQEIMCTQHYISSAVLSTAPMTLDVLYSTYANFSGTLADTVTYSKLNGGYEFVQTALPTIVAASLQDTVVYSKLNPLHEILRPDITFGYMVLRDVLLNIKMSTEVLSNSVHKFEMILGD